MAVENRMLTRRYTAEALAPHLVPLEAWRPFPPAADRAAWDRLQAAPLNAQRRAWIVAKAEKLVGQPWPALPATLYMEFARTGNRSNYESRYFARRAQLATLVFAECFEHRGRFMDEIVNGLVALLEETTWCIPAHAVRLRGDSLQRPDRESVDLFAAETAMSLATVRYLLRAELEKTSPGLVQRIRSEVLRRVVEPVETTDTFGRSQWLKGLNNWAPWCASNVLGAAMLLVDDAPRVAKFAVRMMGVVDRFIDHYGDDGGCDEGPGYWNEAPGAMCVFLELLHARTNGFVDIYGQPKIAAMGRFIVTAHIAGPWFVNFADADAKVTPYPGMVYRFGERVGSEEMKQLALLGQRQWRADGAVEPPLGISGIARSVLGPLMELFWIPPDARPAETSHAATETWLPDLQVLAARETANAARGLFLAAKGGHNAESHNHNDTGHFIVFLDGQPGVIDLGRETYTAQTFGRQRYDLWFARGLGHNAPVVNGVEQPAGAEFAASDVAYALEGDTVQLGMNLEKSYPASAGLTSWRRTWRFDRGTRPQIVVSDRYALGQAGAKVLLPFYTARAATLLAPGRVAIACEPRRLLLEFDPAAIAAKIEEVPVRDAILRRTWGDRVWRVALEHTAGTASGSYELRFVAEER